MKRPDMRAYFASRIDWHVFGMMSGAPARKPLGVRTVVGDVTDGRILVEMEDGTMWQWAGGQYASRKVNGCYAPKMPKPVTS